MLLSLQHVDSKQILHRDLKTQNILLDKKKQIVKIGDFGISKVLSSKSKAYTVCMNFFSFFNLHIFLCFLSAVNLFSYYYNDEIAAC